MSRALSKPELLERLRRAYVETVSTVEAHLIAGKTIGVIQMHIEVSRPEHVDITIKGRERIDNVNVKS